MFAAAARLVTGRCTNSLAIDTRSAAVAAVAPFGLPGRFADAQTNKPSSLVPSDVESVRALEAVPRRNLRSALAGHARPAGVRRRAE